MKGHIILAIIIISLLMTITSTVHAAGPIADFSGSPVTGNAPLIVSNIDLSLNSPSDRAWYFGDENYMAPWTEITASVEWTGRFAHRSVVMPDGSIVLMGGDDGSSSFKNDTWRSTDNGATWALVNASSGWLGRAAHSTVVLPDGTIVLMGGSAKKTVGGSSDYKNDVWKSLDYGATWTQVTASAEWAGRCDHSTVVLPDSSIVLMGGNDGYGGRLNDVWRSIDTGATWTPVTAHADWSARWGQSTVAMPDGSMIMSGGWNGVYFNDVWRSTDNGTTWTQKTATAGWSQRLMHSTVAMPDGSIVLMGGTSDSGNKNDVWQSTDKGATWSLVNASPGWTARHYHSSVVMPNGSIVLMGGASDSGNKNDVWRFQPLGPTVTNIIPATGTDASAISITNLAGTGFYGTPTVNLTKTGESNIMATGVTVVDPTNVTCSFDLTGKMAGLWDVVVTNPDGQKAVLFNGFRIKSSTDIGVFRSGQWILDNGIDRVVDRRFQYGLATDIPIVGDFNNDGLADIGVYRFGQWILDYGMDGTVDRRFQYGQNSDKPVVGDFNNDGTTEIGLFRSGQWILNYGMYRFQYGLATDIPIVGDFNNDGLADIGVFRSGQWILDYGTDGTVDRRFQYGLATDIPIVGDFNNDGLADIGVFRSGQWILDYEMDRVVDRRFQYGLPIDIPIVGNWG